MEEEEAEEEGGAEVEEEEEEEGAVHLLEEMQIIPRLTEGFPQVLISAHSLMPPSQQLSLLLVLMRPLYLLPPPIKSHP